MCGGGLVIGVTFEAILCTTIIIIFWNGRYCFSIKNIDSIWKSIFFFFIKLKKKKNVFYFVSRSRLLPHSINVYFHLIHRQKQLNEQNFDYIINWRENSNVPLNVKRAMGSNAFATNELINTDNNSRKMEKPMMNGTDSSAIMSHRKPYTRLLRRRHSLPEIIMRK